MQSNKLTAIVLAGGRSSRMGQDKALIPIQGVPMLQLVCRVAESCADTVYVVTPWLERYEHLLPPKSQFIREVSLFGKDTMNSRDAMNQTDAMNRVSTRSLPHGPIVGFAQGLAHVQTEWVLLLACDLPKLRVEVLQDWANRLDSFDNRAIAALAHHTKGWEPLCGFYRRCCLPNLMEFINQGGRSFQGWLKQHPVQVLPLPEPEMLFNCNTPEDLLQSFREIST